MDKAGRVLLPATLRHHAGLEKETMLVGQLNKFEIWSDERWQQQIQDDMAAELSGDFELSDRLRDFSL
jgi:MraZ protein